MMLHLITQALVKMSEDNKPIRYASGVIVQYRKSNFLLTVAHATGDQGNWAIQVKYVIGKGSELFRLGGMGFAKQYTYNLKRGTSKERDIDFSYKLLLEDVPSRYQELRPDGSAIVDEDKRVFESDLSSVPNAEGEYGFWGLTRQDYDGSHLTVAPVCVGPMQYMKVNEHTNHYQFRLRQEDQQKGIAEYENCSGAPIFDRDGNLVSLVVETDKRTRYIYGIRLEQLRALLDVEIDIHLQD